MTFTCHERLGTRQSKLCNLFVWSQFLFLVQALDAVTEEPAAGTPGICQVRIRMPDGTNLQRRFHSSDKVLKNTLTRQPSSTALCRSKRFSVVRLC